MIVHVQAWREGLAYAALTVLAFTTVALFASPYKPRDPMAMEPPAVCDLTSDVESPKIDPKTNPIAKARKGRYKKARRKERPTMLHAVTITTEMKGKYGKTHRYTADEERMILRQYKASKGDLLPAEGNKGWYGLVARSLGRRYPEIFGSESRAWSGGTCFCFVVCLALKLAHCVQVQAYGVSMFDMSSRNTTRETDSTCEGAVTFCPVGWRTILHWH